MDERNQAITARAGIARLDRARTFIILLVLLPSVVNYTCFGNGDPTTNQICRMN
jgi:hypothetical protein